MSDAPFPSLPGRERLAREALALVPQLLTLQDRNPHSATYGCFDRNFWHYRILDFPSGMAQEFVFPLALAVTLDVPGNPYRGQPRLRELVAAGVRYAAHAAHRDGSCDDYFPFEKAAGAAAFSLLACVESCRLLGLHDEETDRFLSRRADWLADHHESGRLSNHGALIALGLELVGRRLGTERWRAAGTRRLENVLGWQDPQEGWFAEYEGCDPGYLTLTISVLAWLHELRPSPALWEALRRATEFAAHFIHPDGTFGGEYGSRNTLNYFPHGFELVGRRLPLALELNDRFLCGLADGLGPCYADDHILGHHAWNYLLAWRDFVPGPRSAPKPLPGGRFHFPRAGLLVDRTAEEGTLCVALNKGGVFKLFQGEKCAVSDTQTSVLWREDGGGNTARNAVAHLVDRYEVEATGADRLVVAGRLGWAKSKGMTPTRLVALRLLMLGGGRLFPDLVRRLLQRALITGKQPAPLTFRREFTREPGRGWTVRDTLTCADWSRVAAVGLGGDQTSIYVVMSRTFQWSQLGPWLDLTERARALAPGEALVVERTWPDGTK